MQYRMVTQKRRQHTNVKVLICIDFADDQRSDQSVSNEILVATHISRPFGEALIHVAHMSSINRTICADKNSIDIDQLLMPLIKEIALGFYDAAIVLCLAHPNWTYITSDAPKDLFLRK